MPDQPFASDEPKSLDDLAAEGDAEDQAHEILLQELDSLRAERDELKDRTLRLLAETENMRKRAERDRKEAENYGGSKLARDLLPIYDNLRRALDAVTPEQREATPPSSKASTSPCARS
jgi:molecular chaperone GrpE